MARYIKEKFDPATLDSLADFICGTDIERFPEYRSSSGLTRFFNNINIPVEHDGSTRKWWVLGILNQLTLDDLEKVVLRLVDIREYKGDKGKLELAQSAMSGILFMENMDVVFSGRDPVIISLETSIDPILDTNNANSDEEDFLKKDFEENDISKLNLDSQIEGILKNRISEAMGCLRSGSFLSCIFMTGSSLEGILLGIATNNPKMFNQAEAAPRVNGNVKKFHDWTLADLINVSHEVGVIGLDVKKYSHAMRDFRNYIHPYQQLSSGFNPDEHTAKMCLQALNAAICHSIKSINNEK